MRDNNFKEIHFRLLNEALYDTKYGIIRNLRFTLTNPEDNLGIDANIQYYNAFRDWLFSGSDKQGEFVKLSEKAKKYALEYEGRNVAYGPRIVKQLPILIDKLKRDINTRQAFLNILDERDHIVSKREKGETIVEYPCTIGWGFDVVDGRLNCTSFMRSNNLCSVIGLDVFLGTSLQIHMAEALNLPLGEYTHIVFNAHILPQETKRAIKMVENYEG